jgi:hypothetical protein
MSPATSPAQWQLTLAQLEARLRLFTDHSGCMSGHREPRVTLGSPPGDEWTMWVDASVTTRKAEGDESGSGES